MKKFVALLTKEKRLRMNGKMMTVTFLELYTVYIKKLAQLNSIQFEQFNKLSIKTVILSFLKILLCVCTQYL